MKNKFFLTGVLATVFVLAGNAYAAGQNSNSGGAGNQIEQQTQTVNQGGTNQIKTQNSEQVQAGTSAGAGTGTQIQEQTQQKIQEGTGAGGQVQSQNQVKDKDEASQLQNNQQQRTQNETETSTQRRSKVANAVQEMLQVAERNGEIGHQVKTIAQTQAQNQEKLEGSMQKVQSRSGFAKFFVGPDYGEISNAKKLVEQNKEQIKQLNQIKNQLTNHGDQQALTEQIGTLEQANLEIESSLGTAQKGFSLFGWMFRMFSN